MLMISEISIEFTENRKKLDRDSLTQEIFEQKDNNYIFTTKVNYPNNPNLVKEKMMEGDLKWLKSI